VDYDQFPNLRRHSPDSPEHSPKIAHPNDSFYRSVLSTAGIGAWYLDLKTLDLQSSETCAQNFGRALDQPFTYTDLRSMILPEDFDRWKAAIDAAIWEGTEFRCDYRIITPAGEMRWIHSSGNVGIDKKGNSISISGITQDITARREAEEARAAQQRRAEEVLSGIQDIILTIDRNWEIVFANQRARQLFSPFFSAEMMTGASLWELPQSRNTILESHFRTAAQERKVVTFELAYEPLQRLFWVRAYPHMGGIVVCMIDLAKLP
jgi:PAS domain S-box-containing protein